MPLNVRRYCTSVLLVLSVFILVAEAQTVPPVTSPSPQVTPSLTLSTCRVQVEHSCGNTIERREFWRALSIRQSLFIVEKALFEQFLTVKTVAGPR